MGSSVRPKTVSDEHGWTNKTAKLIERITSKKTKPKAIRDDLFRLLSGNKDDTRDKITEITITDTNHSFISLPHLPQQ